MTTITVQHLPWDSAFLGYEVGRLEAQHLSAAGLQQQLTAARAAGYRLLYWFVRPEDAESAASARQVGALLADRKIRISQAVAPGPEELPEGISVAPALTDELRRLAVQASEHSRFRLDAGFAPKVAARLYERWLERALAGELAREVLQFQTQPGAPATGLLVLSATPPRAEMVMMAVESLHRGQGVGARFIEAARCRARTWGLPELQLVTQATNPACRLYQREGFRTEKEEHVYHLWL